jgi:hypothetical protein
MPLVSKSFSDIITFSRGTNATYFDSAGVLKYAPNNAIRNNTMVGAVAGTPGTLPTNWGYAGIGTLTSEIVGTGTSNGINYIDIRISGTTSTTQFSIRFDASNVIAAANGQTWAFSWWQSVVAGSTTNLTVIPPSILFFDAANSFLGGNNFTAATFNSTSNFTRQSGSLTISAAGTAFVQPQTSFLCSSGVAIDITLRIGLPQLEIGNTAGPAIPTSGTAYYGPRFDYNPSTLAAQGLLIEEQRTNLVTYSEDILSWTNVSGATFSSTAATAPDGTTTANSIVEDNSLGNRRAWIGVTTAASATYTVSCFIKALPGSAQRYVRLILWDPALTNGYAVLFCDPNTGTVTGTNLSAAAVTDGWSNLVANAVQDCGSGWYRFSMTVTTGTGTALRVQNAVVDLPGGTFTGGTGGALNYTGDGSSGAYVWGAQLEAGAFPTSYIPTTTTALTRAADVASVNTLSPWFNSSEYTVYAEFQRDTTSGAVSGGAGSVPRIFTFAQAASAGLVQLRLFSATGIEATATASPSGYIVSSWAVSSVVKVAVGYKVDDFVIDTNVGVLATDTSLGAVTGTDQLALGQNRVPVGSGYLNGWLRRITYYPRRLSDAELAAITS